MTKPLYVIMAYAKFGNELAIGLSNDLPWIRLKEDMKLFRECTMGSGAANGTKNAVIMGRKTFESMKSNPLKGRINYVITSEVKKVDIEDTLYFCRSFDEAIEKANENGKVNEIWAIGGSKVYCDAMDNDCCRGAYLTLVDYKGPYDVWVDNKVFFNDKWVMDSEHGIKNHSQGESIGPVEAIQYSMFRLVRETKSS